MIIQPKGLFKPRWTNTTVSTAAVRTRYAAAVSVPAKDGVASPTIAPGINSPATTLRLLLVRAVLKAAAPRIFVARWTAATALGRLVTAARMTPPTTASEMWKWLPS